MIRDELPDDVDAIRQINLDAFRRPVEAQLVDELRADGDLLYSLVVVEEGRVVGHVAFSPMAAPFRALGLGPIAAVPDRQRRGFARRLIEAGLARATADGWQAVFLLGNPAFYERFGFSTGLAAGFATSYAGPHFMVRPLGDGALPTLTGNVAYAPAFDRVDG